MKLVISVICLAFLGYVQAEIKCVENAVDMVFVVDSSSSIWPGNYELYVKPFIKDVVNMFDVGPGENDTRVGIVTFNNDYHLQFHLNKFLSKESVMKGIEGIRFTTGNTYTNKALQYATSTMYTPEHGSRSNVQNVMIILTDGESDKPELTRAAANQAKAAGINIFSIGVGTKVKVTELNDMASEPSESFVFELDDFQSLESIRNPFSKRTCAVIVSTTQTPTTEPITTTTKRPLSTTTIPTTTTTRPTTTTTKPTTTTIRPTTTTARSTTTTTITTTSKPIETTTTRTTPKRTTTTSKSTTTSTTQKPTPPTPKPAVEETTPKNVVNDQRANTTYCGGKPADIYFVLDSSSSVWIEDFNFRMLTFVRDVVDTFEIGPTLARVGLVIYSDTVKPVFGLKSFNNRESLLNAIHPETVKYMSGRTNTADAIKYVRETGFGKRASSARTDAAHVMVVITDGISKDPRATRREAAEAKKAGANIFSIGVGPYIDQQELADIASDPNQKFVFNVENYGALSSIRTLLAVQACEVIPEVPKDVDVEKNPCKITPTNVHFVYKSSTRSIDERTAIKEVIRRFTTNEQNKHAPIHMGITTDKCKKDTQIPFSSMETFRHNLNNLMNKDEIMLHSLMNTARREARTGRDNVMVVFIDESTTDLNQVMAEAMRAKFQGFKVFVVAVGDVDSRIVSRMVSSPTNQYVQTIDNYQQMDKVQVNILSMLCAPTAIIRGKTMINPYEGLRVFPEIPEAQ
ncbi:hypothetical protein SNE40_004416 [Patella caerulea]|uniref:VWFA domain-containing protein n=1 Tax=Patella caerulea TaxID=87958 RepID=A0AAN8K9A4_PATCE